MRSLSAVARAAIESEANEPVVSMASVWEMGIKISLGNLDVGMDLEQFVNVHILGNGMDLLAITPAHVGRIVGLVFHHRDPFDRLLIAQALEESMAIVGRDPEFSNYAVSMIW
jgi:PIN domain nuclease of toxin-antitoxin system